jgi:hypothetical protein
VSFVHFIDVGEIQIMSGDIEGREEEDAGYCSRRFLGALTLAVFEALDVLRFECSR